MKLSPGSRVIRCEKAVSGHLMVPISDFNERTIGSNEHWIVYGTLGMNGADDQDIDRQSNGRIVQNCSQAILGRGQGSRH